MNGVSMAMLTLAAGFTSFALVVALTCWSFSDRRERGRGQRYDQHAGDFL
jgi:hypothetical protein